MAITPPPQPVSYMGRYLRLRTLTNLRWMGAAGQMVTILIVYFVLGFHLPLGWCLAAIAASLWLNLFTVLRTEGGATLSPLEAAGHLAFDLVQLAIVLFLTGGLSNPFAVLILAPATIAASVLPRKFAWSLLGLAFVLMSLLALFHLDLPWREGTEVVLPRLYAIGVWISLVIALGFLAIYARQVAAEHSKMTNALAATQMVLAREEQVSALGGLAAAAAHELGTPLATIQLTAKEMAAELEDHELKEDALLVVAQARRCRDILTRLSDDAAAGDARHDNMSLRALIEEAAAPFTAFGGVRIDLSLRGPDPDMPDIDGLKRRPELIYGLRNIIENAVKYARGSVTVEARWSERDLSICILDDGEGFSSEMLSRLGEPYLARGSERRNTARRQEGTVERDGLGLGFFIAKTLLERTGARIAHGNRPRRTEESGETAPKGAWVRLDWPLANLKNSPKSGL